VAYKVFVGIAQNGKREEDMVSFGARLGKVERFV
jgi:hypothetical protein